jgi:hypothetical protein
MDMEYMGKMMDELQQDWMEKYDEIFNEDQINAIGEMILQAMNTCMESMCMGEEEEFEE